ncbi:MAG: ribonuclease E activity regulator RraA [Steroidobacteraceae bacterium]|jgi:regulator of ribonuclease activity A
MAKTTADLSDAHPHAQIAEPLFRDFGALHAFHGPMVTVKVFEDNALVRTLLEEPGAGRVLVVDGGGSMRCALVGGNLAQLGVANGWHGLVVFGCIRDSEEIRHMAIGVKALATHPRKSDKGLHTGHRDRAVMFAGVTFRSGDWVYADSDGILVSAGSLNG